MARKNKYHDYATVKSYLTKFMYLGTFLAILHGWFKIATAKADRDLTNLDVQVLIDVTEHQEIAEVNRMSHTDGPGAPAEVVSAEGDESVVEELKHDEKVQVFFMKTHKTGSSTVQNILFRYGYRNGLKFLIPRGPYFSYPKPMSIKFVRTEGSSGLPGHIFAHHSRMNVKEFAQQKKKLFEAPERVRGITILRDPGTLIESAFRYFNYDVVKQLNRNVTAFLQDPVKLLNDSTSPQKQLLRNGMSFDFGFTFNSGNMTSKDISRWAKKDSPFESILYHTQEKEKMDRMVEFVEENFELVMITEYFDESMILLKHMMGWDMDDIVYTIANANKKHEPSSSAHATPSKRKDSPLASKARVWAYADSYLYAYFNQTFWKKVDDFGRNRMNRELGVFRNRLEAVYNQCFQGTSSDPKMLSKYGFYKPYPTFKTTYYVIQPAELNNSLCRDIARSEKRFSANIFRRQFPTSKVPTYFTK